MAYHKNY